MLVKNCSSSGPSSSNGKKIYSVDKLPSREQNTLHAERLPRFSCTPSLDVPRVCIFTVKWANDHIFAQISMVTYPPNKVICRPGECKKWFLLSARTSHEHYLSFSCQLINQYRNKPEIKMWQENQRDLSDVLSYILHVTVKILFFALLNIYFFIFQHHFQKSLNFCYILVFHSMY